MRNWPALSGAVRAVPSASSTTFMRSGPVVVSLDQRSSPRASNSATLEARGSRDRTSWTYGSKLSQGSGGGVLSVRGGIIPSPTVQCLGGGHHDEAFVGFE